MGKFCLQVLNPLGYYMQVFTVPFPNTEKRVENAMQSIFDEL